MTVVPSQKVHFEEELNKTSPSQKSRLFNFSHFGHFSMVYAKIISSLEKIIVELQQYFQHRLLQQIALQEYFQGSSHAPVSGHYQPDQQFP